MFIITGGTHGIGRATAEVLASQGKPVLITGRDEESGAEADRQIPGAEFMRADIADEADCRAVAQHAMEVSGGQIGGLVNNVGIPGRIGRVEDLDMDMLRHVLDVNVVGSFLCAREAVKAMSTRHGGRGGAIVNLSSMGATTGSPGELVHYAAAKGAIESFTRGLAREVATEGIRVNAVSPGLIDTDIHAEAGDAERVARYATRMPMARVGKPEEVAEAILWFLSEASSYVTATVLPVAGGR